MKKFQVLVVAVLALMLMVGFASANNEATVYVVHGIPGVLVDVEVEGVGCALQGFDFGDIAGPLSLPEGTYNIKIRPANAMNPCSEMPVIEADVPFAAGENVTVVAHLDDMGNPTASKFDNDFSPTGRGKARLIVHHTAYAPMVDVKVSRNGGNSPKVMVNDFSNGDQAVTETRPGDWFVSIMPAGSMTPVFGPTPVELEPFTAYRIYAVGDVAGGTFTLLVFPYDGLK
jgi:hypothetical protein